MSVRGAPPKIVPPPRRANSPSVGRQDSDATPRAPPRTPSRRAASRSVGRAPQEDEGIFGEASTGAISRPAEFPQQVASTRDPPPVRRASTPVSSARGISALPPSVRSHPQLSTLASSSHIIPNDSATTGSALTGPFTSRDGEPITPAGAGTQHKRAAPPSLEERQALARALEGRDNVRPKSSTPPPNDPPFGPSRTISLAQQTLQSQKPQPHSAGAATPSSAMHSAHNGHVSLVEVSTFSPGGGASPFIVDLRRGHQDTPAPSLQTSGSQLFGSAHVDQPYRRPHALGDSPSSPPTGKRSVLAPTKTLVRTAADADRSVVSSLSRVNYPHHEQQHQSGNSFCYVQSRTIDEPRLSGATTFSAVRAPASGGGEWAAPPPFIQASIDRHTDSNASYAPQASRWENLERARGQQQKAHSALSDGGRGAAYVLCVIQIVCSESHFVGDDAFDPVPEVRLRLSDIGSIPVKRLIELIHVSLNFTPKQLGVIRCYASENKAWVIKPATPRGSSSGAGKCVSFGPMDAPMSNFVDVHELLAPFDAVNSDAVLHLRWIEDAWVAPTVALTAQAAPSVLEEHIHNMQHVGVRGPSVASSAAGSSVSFGGYRVERDPAPVTYVPDSRTHVHNNHVPFTLAAPTTSTSTAQSRHMSRTSSEVIPVLRVPSRSQSATSTPNMSPVRRTPGATTPAAALEPPADAFDASGAGHYHIQPEHLLSTAEGVRRFGQPLLAPTQSASRTASQRPSQEAHEDRLRNDTRPIPFHAHTHSLSGVDDAAVFEAESGVAASSRASSTIVVDGVAYTPTTSRAQQLAEEIAALRTAIFSEDKELHQARGLLLAQAGTPRSVDV